MKTPECQPSLFELPEVPKDPTDFLTPKGKKRNSIPTGMKREEIINLKKNGIQITYEIEKRILCYLCDTTINVFQDERIFKYDTIMIECTFIRPEHLDRAIERNHINWMQLEPYVRDNQKCDFILFHWSKLYSPEEIKEYFEKYLQIYPNLKIWI